MKKSYIFSKRGMVHWFDLFRQLLLNLGDERVRRIGTSRAQGCRGSSRPKTGPRVLALNGLALWSRANS